MKSLLRIGLIPLALAAAALVSGFFGSPRTTGYIENFGRFTYESETTIHSPHTVAGTEALLDGIQWVETTTSIPAKIGTTFGIEYVIRGKNGDYAAVTEVMTFPGGGLTNPETGRTVKISPYPNYVACNEAILMGYGLDTDWEVQPGEWIFQVKEGNRILLEKRFQVE